MTPESPNPNIQPDSIDRDQAARLLFEILKGSPELPDISMKKCYDYVDGYIHTLPNEKEKAKESLKQDHPSQ